MKDKLEDIIIGTASKSIKEVVNSSLSVFKAVKYLIYTVIVLLIIGTSLAMYQII